MSYMSGIVVNVRITKWYFYVFRTKTDHINLHLLTDGLRWYKLVLSRVVDGKNTRVYDEL